MKILLITIFLILIVLGSMIYGFNLFSWREKYTDYSCDVGDGNITGDFVVSPDSFLNSRQCAIEDCGAFNKIQKKNDIKMRCVV